MLLGWENWYQHSKGKAVAIYDVIFKGGGF